MKKHLLFVCSGGIDRSPTAAELFKGHSKFEARSCGLYPLMSDNAVTKHAIIWADYIFAMEPRHKRDLLEMFPLFLQDKPEIIILDVSNDYTRNSPELEELLRVKLEEWLD